MKLPAIARNKTWPELKAAINLPRIILAPGGFEQVSKQSRYWSNENRSLIAGSELLAPGPSAWKPAFRLLAPVHRMLKGSKRAEAGQTPSDLRPSQKGGESAYKSRLGKDWHPGTMRPFASFNPMSGLRKPLDCAEWPSWALTGRLKSTPSGPS